MKTKLDVLHITQPTTEGVAEVVRSMCHRQTEAGLRLGVRSPVNETFWTRLLISTTKFAWKASRSLSANLVSEFIRLCSVLSHIDSDVICLHSFKAALLGRRGLLPKNRIVYQPNRLSFEAARGVVVRDDQQHVSGVS